jgi:uncharacterized iron-regulated membrane protein
MHWLYPLHSGSAFGSPGLLAMCLTGTLPLLLVATGLWVWLRKRRGERIGRQRRERRQVGSAHAGVNPNARPAVVHGAHTRQRTRDIRPG